MKNPWKALNTQLSRFVEDAHGYLVRVEAGRRPTTGTVYGADDEQRGLIVTTAHALGRSEGIEVVRPDGRRAPATLVGFDARTDLALLRVEPAPDKPLTAAPWGDSATLSVGHLALTLGRPGASVGATLGMVSAIGPAWRTGLGAEIDRYIDIDGRLPVGFSGGVLLDLEGAVLGLNTHDLVRGGTTIPAETVRRVVEQLRTRGRVARGHLGVSIQPVRLPTDVADTHGQAGGVLLTHVEPDGPAGRAGLQLGDVLLGLGGRPVLGYADLVAAKDAAAGTTAEAHLLRGGTPQRLAVEVGEATDDERRPRTGRGHGCHGGGCR